MYRLVKRKISWLGFMLFMCVSYVATVRCSSDILMQMAAVCSQLYRKKDEDIIKEGGKGWRYEGHCFPLNFARICDCALRIKFNWKRHLNPKSYENSLLLATEDLFLWLQSNERKYVGWGHAVETPVSSLPVIFLSYFLILCQWAKWMILQPAKNWFHPLSTSNEVAATALG